MADRQGLGGIHIPAQARAGRTIFQGIQIGTSVVERVRLPFTLLLHQLLVWVTQAAMTGGVAMSLGLALNAVTLTKINGDAASSSSRQLANGRKVDIGFRIVSASADTAVVAKLNDDVKTVASDGAVVANIQKKANDAGGLVKAVVVTTSSL